MTENQTFTDEELTAYLDGEADEELRKSIDAACTEDNALKQRLDTLTIDKEQIEAAFDALLDQAPSNVELPDVKKQGGMSPTLYKVAVAALVALVVGVGVGNKFSQNAQLSGWRGYVAAYHALYSDQTLADISQTSGDAEQDLADAASAIDLPITIDVLRASDELTFKRSQVLAFRGNPLLQLAFVTADGTPVALCVLRKPDLPDSGPRTAILEGMPATSWSKNGYDFILIGGNDSTLIERAANAYAAKL